MSGEHIPRVLIIDDLFGRTLPFARNEDRANLCGQFLLRDITGDETGKGQPQKIRKPTAEAFFCRGQRPSCAVVGDVVENDLPGILETIRRGWPPPHPEVPPWSLVLLDLCFYTGKVTPESDSRVQGMPEGREAEADPRTYFGLKILETVHDEFPDLPVVILSSKPRAEVSREFAVHGALAFLERDASESPSLLQDYIDRHGLIPNETGEILGYSRSLLRALRAARRAAYSRQNIVIRGERGTGKELLARYVYRTGLSQKARPLVVVDSGALTPELYASALFGHNKGAFTGADQRRVGSIVEASGGDLFLDEIGNMPVEVQRGLLRVLEYRKVAPLGSGPGESISVDVRFLSATNADIEAMSSSGTFREDLYDRLREGGVLFLPPLRERKEDIPILVERAVRQAEAGTPGALHRQVEPEALEMICAYSWPGNIRQLRNCIFNAVANHPDVEHLFPVHLEIDSETRRGSSAAPVVATSGGWTAPPDARAGSLPEVVSLLNSFDFVSMKPAQFAGKLRELQDAWARFMARYLKASLSATKRPTPSDPDGQFFVLPAIQLLTGDRELKAWQAYDLIKRIAQLSPTVLKELPEDPILSIVLDRSRKSRNR